MASENYLLGSGAPQPAQKAKPVYVNAPAWRYHRDFPTGKIARTDEEIDKLDASGWVDHPAKLKEDYAPPVIKPVEVVTEPTPEMLEDAKKADALKAESDKLARMTEALDFHCKECGREFSGAQALRMHVLSHKPKVAAAPPEEPTP